MTLVLKHVRSHLVGYLAVVLAFSLGGGAAVAAGLVTSRDIKNDTIRPVDLNFVVGQDAASTPKSIPLDDTFQTVSKVVLSVGDEGGTAMAQAAVEIENTTLKPVEVQLRLAHVGHPEHTKTFTTTVAAGTTESAPASLQCNGIPTGLQTIALKVAATEGVSITDSTLTALATPRL